jgi:hypothetical protein
MSSRLDKVRLNGGAFFAAAIAALLVAAGARAQTENQWRYQFDQSYHIVYYSPEAFGCYRPGNLKNIGAAMAKTQQEIQQLNAALGEFPTSEGLSSMDKPSVNALTGMIRHLTDILVRLQRLPPCDGQAPSLTNGPPPAGGDTGGTGNGGTDENGGSGDGGPAPPDANGGDGQGGVGGCVSGNDGGQGDCGMDQHHNDNGNKHHSNH